MHLRLVNYTIPALANKLASEPRETTDSVNDPHGFPEYVQLLVACGHP